MSFVRELYELCERRGAFLDIRGARLAHGTEWADVSVDEYGVTGKVGRPVTERTRIVDIYQPGDAYIDASPDLDPEIGEDEDEWFPHEEWTAADDLDDFDDEPGDA